MYECRFLRSSPNFAILSLAATFLLTACSGNKTTAGAIAPVFVSVPVTQAVEGSPYGYQLTLDESAVKLSLTSAPIGATLSVNTIAWTPTAAQSRIPNSFTVTATASDGGSATQTWTVTPSGTIRISWIDTLWNETGSTQKPFDWTRDPPYTAALVPQPDGSFQSLFGSVGASGEFEIPGVPAGYYWLKIGPFDTYWTSSSTFDMGRDVFIPVTNLTVPTSSRTSIAFNFTSLDPTPASGLLLFDTLESGALNYFASTNPGSTTSSGGLAVGSNLDFSNIRNGFVRQYEAASFGPVNGYVLGPELTLSNLSLTTGGFNTISGALNPTVPASIHLSVQSSAWIPLFDHIAPTTPTATGGGFYLSVEPYIAADGANVSSSVPIDLISTKASVVSSPNSPNLNSFIRTGTCSANPPLTADVEAGSVPYGDPFPASWRRIFRVCHSVSVDVLVPGTTTPQTIDLSNNQTTALPTATVKPLLSAVLNPKINGADLFTASTVNSTAVTLSWDPPAIGTPFGYNVEIMTPTASPSGVSYFSSTTLGTAKTSLTIPTGVLASARTYLFVITSLADAKANMETSPHRSLLPIANADVISAPIATN